MNFKLEVIVLPVTDVDRSLAFYKEGCKFDLDVDYRPSEAFRVVQLTPRGSSCSIQLGIGLTDAAPGTFRNMYLVVTDIAQAVEELAAGGVPVKVIRHKVPIDNWSGGTEEGLDSERRDYASLATFADPDGNTWTLQEIGYPPDETESP